MPDAPLCEPTKGLYKQEHPPRDINLAGKAIPDKKTKEIKQQARPPLGGAASVMVASRRMSGHDLLASITAAKLGAATVLATDRDAAVLELTAENARGNGALEGRQKGRKR